MLTKDLLRFAVKDGRIQPRWLRPTPAVLQTAQDLLAYWKGGIGQVRGDLDDGASPILHRSRSLPVARGLQKLIVDACTFAEPGDASALRERAFAASAARLLRPTAQGEAHRAAVAADVDLDADTLDAALYADLPDQAVLREACPWDAEDLLARYNLALAQGLLLRARELAVTVRDADIGLRRRLLSALRWRRLLARVGGDDDQSLSLVVSGPDAVLDQATRYGLNLAQWLPDLCAATDWTARCTVPTDRHGGTAILELGDSDGLRGSSAYLGHVPAEIRSLRERLVDAEASWTVGEGDLLPLADGEIAVPDLQISVGGRTVRIECFHRWHARALERRLRQTATLPPQALLLGVDRNLAKAKATAPLIDTPAFQSRGFLFSDLPTANVVRRALRDLLGWT